MAEIVHKVGVKAGISEAFKAISTVAGLSKWWTNDVSESNGVITFRFRKLTGELVGEMKMRVKESIADKKVLWLCEDGPAEWIGTEILFELSRQDDFTIILFWHRKWKETVEFTHHCSTKWAVFLLSLKEYLETGKGQPSPHDLKIDNWN